MDSTGKEAIARELPVTIHENAVLDLVILNGAASNVTQVMMYDIHVHAGGELNLGLFVKDGTLNKHIVTVVLEDGAKFNTYGHIMNNQGGESSVVTKVYHDGASSFSTQLFCSEAGEDSKTVFYSKVVIAAESDLSVADISSVGLVTGDSGKCYNTPIVINQSCTAKSSVGAANESLDYERIYYLQTRGMPLEAAQGVL
ncbi:uncharacterized protein, partial [Procambarus clarkii]|uniref:uncharacterized protein n=1 Tax=Procambarus clarkii TaxID=6728 RepID=UPI003743904F